MKLLCLANSYKEGGKCLAGVQLDDQNRPLRINGRPRWIRPVCATTFGQVPNYLCAEAMILDIIEIDKAEVSETGYQPENTTFDKDSIRILGKLERDILDEICDNEAFTNIFGNTGNAITKEAIEEIGYSLMFLKINQFQITEKNRQHQKRPQLRFTFKYRGQVYNFPITDPDFLLKYALNKQLLDGITSVYVVLSISVPFNDAYYKLVGTIIY